MCVKCNLCNILQIKGDFDAVAAKEDPEGGKEMEDKGIKVAPSE